MSAGAAVPRRRGFIVTFVALLIGQYLGVSNSTIVVTALPEILKELNGTPAEGTWMVSGTMLAVTVATPIWGRLADRYSPIKLLTIVLCAVLVSAVVLSFSSSTLMVQVGRATQGLFLGGLFSLTMIALAYLVPPRERGKYMGWMSAVNLVGMISAPLLGGLIVQSPLGWRGCFYVAIPLAVTMLVLLRFTPPLEQPEGRRGRIDIPGAILLAAGLVGIQLWLSFVGKSFDPVSWVSLGLLGGGLLVLVTALVVEWHADIPILPIRLLGGRVLGLATIAGVCYGMAGYTVTVFMTMYFQIGRGLPPALSGLLIVAVAVGTVISSFSVGALTTRSGRLRRYLVLGTGLLALGILLVGLAGPDAPLGLVMAILLLIGLGQGATNQFITLAAQNAVALRDLGAVSGFMNFLQTLGGSTAMATATGLLTTRLAEYGAEGLTEAQGYARAIPEIFLWLSIVPAAALVAVSLLPRIRLRKTIDLDEGAGEAD